MAIQLYFAPLKIVKNVPFKSVRIDLYLVAWLSTLSLHKETHNVNLRNIIFALVLSLLVEHYS